MILTVTFDIQEEGNPRKTALRFEIKNDGARDKIQRVIDFAFKDMHRKALGTFMNGWCLDDAVNDGEMICLYCGERTKGFNFGKYPRTFEPYSTPCLCRNHRSVQPTSI